MPDKLLTAELLEKKLRIDCEVGFEQLIMIYLPNFRSLILRD